MANGKEEIKIIREDSEVVAINKPAGLEMQEVMRWASSVLKIQDGTNKEFEERRGVAHRLDRETSGCLLIAKTAESLKNLMDQFRRRKIKKEYLALVHGRMEPVRGIIRLPLRRSKSNRLKREVRYDGKMAETEWLVISYYGDYTLVRLKPRTGRTHQLRVHLSHLGYPIFADEKYLRKDQSYLDRQKLKHHFLHAEKISYKSLSGGQIECQVDLSDDEKKLLMMLE